MYSLVLVYHLGGRTLQVTLISVNSGMYRILDSFYNNSIGGESFDEVLVSHLADEFKRYMLLELISDVFFPYQRGILYLL